MSTVAMVGPRTSLFDKTSTKNRLAASGEHLSNHLKSATGIALGTGAGAFLGHSLYKSGLKTITHPDYLKMMDETTGFKKVAAGAKYLYTTAQDKVVTLLKNEGVQEMLGKSDAFIDKLTKGGLNKLNRAFRTKGAKTGLAVAVVTGLIALVRGVAKHGYRKAKIEDKYSDKTK